MIERPRDVIEKIFNILDEGFPDDELTKQAYHQKQVLFDKLRYFVPQVIRVDNHFKRSKSDKE